MRLIIVGGGQVGSYLASLLKDNDNSVVIIENRKKNIDLISLEHPEVRLVVGSGSDPKILEEAGIIDADVLAAVTGEDETNLVVSTLARMEYGIPRVVARVNNPKNAWLYTPQMGVDVSLNQAELIAHLVQEEVASGDLVPLVEINQGDFMLVEKLILEDQSIVGKSLTDLVLPGASFVTIVIRDGAVLPPDKVSSLMVGDKLIAVCPVDLMDDLSVVLDK